MGAREFAGRGERARRFTIGPAMQMLSEDDLNLRDMTEEELAKAWDLWFTLAQATNDDDPLYTHGVFTNVTREDLEEPADSANHENEGARFDIQPGCCHSLQHEGRPSASPAGGRRPGRFRRSSGLASTRAGLAIDA